MIKNRIFLALLLLASIVGMAAMGCSPQTSGETAKVNQVALVLYFAVNAGDELAAEERSVPKGDVSLAEQALMELIAGPKTQGHLRALPKESVLLSVEVRDGIAYVDLGSETAENHFGGSLGDKISVSSIVYTLTELPGITAVQLMLEGEIVEAVFGHIATDKPLTR